MREALLPYEFFYSVDFNLCENVHHLPLKLHIRRRGGGEKFVLNNIMLVVNNHYTTLERAKITSQMGKEWAQS